LIRSYEIEKELCPAWRVCVVNTFHNPVLP
jgi:hypothetical protein